MKPWATFDDRRAAWHEAKLWATLHGLLLVFVGALVVGTAVALAAWQRSSLSVRLIVEVVVGASISGVGLTAARRLEPNQESRHRARLTIVAVTALVAAWIEVQYASDALSVYLSVIRSVLALATLAAAAGAMFVMRELGRFARARARPVVEYPDTEQEVVDLVRRALAQNLTIRVHGSDHSVIGSIAEASDSRCVHVSLARLNRIVEYDEPNRRVRVQAGCVLGVDPARPSSTPENSLLHQLDRRGWGLPLLGGVTHQTVAGFMMTGSSGGSTAYSLSDSIVGLRLVDGTAIVHDLTPNPDDPRDDEHNLFYAAGVSLGLLGIVTEVTFQCEVRFDVVGQEATAPVSAAEIDLQSNGEAGLASAFRRMEYARLMWWPQRGVECMQIWQASRARPEDVPLHRRPYVQVPGGRPVQTLLGLYFRWANGSMRRTRWRARWMTRVTNAFVSVGLVRFDGAWYQTVPMDNEIDNDILPTAFSELWIDLDRAHEVGAVLAEFYAADVGHQRAGSFACELYAAKRNRFWLSPGHGCDTIRVDLMHIERGAIRPETEYFPQFWSLLASFGPRYHWGKLMPPAGSLAGPDYFARVYPRWGDFLRVRSRLDPQDVFVNAYWRTYLGLGADVTR